MENPVAWFVCRAKGIVSDIALPLRADAFGVPEAEIARRGRMKAARQFKRDAGLHPCTKVAVEFQAVMPRAAYYLDGGK